MEDIEGEEPVMLQQHDDYDRDVPLAQREERWGFTLADLQAATRVVGTLFRDPSLFVGDPYLSDSRLYTMITRDRKSKRENRDIYKAIMNEEKSRRKRYQRLQDIEAVGRTAMKREREDALNALLLGEGPRASPLLLCERPTVEETTVASDPCCTSSSSGLSPTETSILRLIGAFENTLRLQRALKGLSNAGKEVEKEVCSAGTALHTGGSVRVASPVDWLEISQLTAQVYRYMPHAFGSQMPPPLWSGPVPSTALAKTYRDYIVGVKVEIARAATQLVHLTPPCRGDAANNSASAPSLATLLATVAADGVVHSPHAKHHLEDISTLRQLVSGAANVSASELAATVVSVSADVLRAMEVVLVEGGRDERFTPAPGVDAESFTPLDVAEQSLNLFIARRLYQTEKLEKLGQSPLIVERQPPTSDSQEQDGWCTFEEVQQYAIEHHDDDNLKLSKWRSCNICKVKYNRLHPYYYSMCHLCGEYNYNKRLMARDLRGKVVLLTGCRIKIGYAMAVSLLRCGATVLGTTRFAHEAVDRFQQEPDYDVWKDRLHLFSLDLRDMWVVTQFCAFVRNRYPKIFAIINNAAQTIARTPQYTEHLRDVEMNPPAHLKDAIAADAQADEWHAFFLSHTTVTVGQALSIEHAPQAPFLSTSTHDGGEQTAAREEIDEGNEEEEVGGGEGGSKAGVMSTTRTTSSRTVVFDRYDTQAEESDHRETNSWVMKLAEVQGSEAAEVMSINALSPFIMNGKLKPCLVNRDGDADPTEPRFIINVSAMEGQFYRFKQTTHPHTNMAKAALNMMTRTSAEDYAQDGIYMNSVDTGWITDESPKMKKERRAEQYMLCPLDEVDAAARCLDLIYTNSGAHGKFYKDYKEIPW